jgi:hypothetical protein
VSALGARLTTVDASVAANATALGAQIAATNAAIVTVASALSVQLSAVNASSVGLVNNIDLLNRSIFATQSVASLALGRAAITALITASLTFNFTVGNGALNVGPTDALNARSVVTMASAPAGVQLWTVPATGPYVFVLAGASGGLSFDGYTSNNYPGGGRIGYATVNLTRGQIIGVVVGQAGVSSTPFNSGSLVLTQHKCQQGVEEAAPWSTTSRRQPFCWPLAVVAVPNRQLIVTVAPLMLPRLRTHGTTHPLVQLPAFQVFRPAPAPFAALLEPVR